MYIHIYIYVEIYVPPSAPAPLSAASAQPILLWHHLVRAQAVSGTGGNPVPGWWPKTLQSGRSSKDGVRNPDATLSIYR